MLGLPSAATWEEVTYRYRSLSKKNHPDTADGSPYLFKQIGVAYLRIKADRADSQTANNDGLNQDECHQETHVVPGRGHEPDRSNTQAVFPIIFVGICALLVVVDLIWFHDHQSSSRQTPANLQSSSTAPADTAPLTTPPLSTPTTTAIATTTPPSALPAVPFTYGATGTETIFSGESEYESVHVSLHLNDPSSTPISAVYSGVPNTPWRH